MRSPAAPRAWAQRGWLAGEGRLGAGPSPGMGLLEMFWCRVPGEVGPRSAVPPGGVHLRVPVLWVHLRSGVN